MMEKNKIFAFNINISKILFSIISLLVLFSFFLFRSLSLFLSSFIISICINIYIICIAYKLLLLKPKLGIHHIENLPKIIINEHI